MSNPNFQTFELWSLVIICDLVLVFCDLLSLRNLLANCAGEVDGQPVNIPAPLLKSKG